LDRFPESVTAVLLTSGVEKGKETMCKVLVIYEEIPEETHLFFKDVSDEDFGILSRCTGDYINGSMSTENAEALLNLLNDASGYFKPEWVDSKIPLDQPTKLSGDITVIHTGFML
jgi:hypothetical protein